MTATTEKPGTEVDPGLAGALEMVRGTDPWTVADLVARMTPPAEDTGLIESAPDMPKRAVLAPEVIAAMGALPGIFGKIHPGTRRSLTGPELVALRHEQDTLVLVTKALEGREDAIKELIRNHIDAQGPGAPTDSKGHRILAAFQKPFRVTAPGTGSDWSQEYTRGKSTVSEAALQAAVDAGEIDRETMLGFTRAVRVIDTEKISAYLRRNPGKGLAALKRITVRGTASTSLNTRKTK